MQALVTLAIVVAVAAVVAVPAVLAILRRHPSWMAITLVSATLGWTGVGWLAALWLSLRPAERRRPRVKTRRPKAPKSRPTRRAAPAAHPVHVSANDNMSSAPRRGDVDDILPGVAAPNPYQDWLEQGEALPGSESSIEAVAGSEPHVEGGLAA